MRKIVVATAVICQVFSFQPVAVRNVDSAQTNIVTPSDSTCDWPMFGRTPDGNRVAPDGCGFKLNSVKKNWSFQTKGKIDGSCAISNNKVYFNSYDKRFICLDILSGKLIWEFTVKDVRDDTTPAISEQKVFFVSNDGAMICLEKETGRKIWEFKTSNWMLTSPILIDDKIVFGSGDRKICCLSQKNGAKIWEFNALGRMITIPVYNNGKIYCGSDDNALYCIDAKSGKKLWMYISFWSEYSYLVIQANRIFFKAGDPENSIVCLNAEDGEVVWYKHFKDYVTSSCIVYNNKLLFGSDDRKFHCISSIDGKDVWEYKTKGWICSSPVLADNRIFFGSDDGYLYCLDINSGKHIWDYNTKGSIKSAPVVVNGKVYFGNVNGEFYCLEDFYKEMPVPTKIFLASPTQKPDLCTKLQLFARITDQYNEEIDAPLQWSVDPEFGTIDSSGLFTPKKTGKVKITCKSGDLSESITIDVIEFLTVNSEKVTLNIANPKLVTGQTVVYTNNSDGKLSVDLASNLGLVKINPESFALEPGKSQQVTLSVLPASFVPLPDTEFIITATYGTCPKKLSGVITSLPPFACLTATPNILSFGLVKRGNEKTISVSLLSEVDTNISVASSEPWISISAKEITLKAGVPASIEFKIMASSLPPSSKFSANITVKSDTDFCDTLTIPVTVETEENITIKLGIDSKYGYINGQERVLDAPPKIIAGRTMVPLRFISEAFGCNIEWDAGQQRIGIVRYDISVILWIGKDYVEVNGQRLKIDAPPVIVGGRTMVPLRFIAEPFGAKVDWNAQAKQITIVWPKP